MTRRQRFAFVGGPVGGWAFLMWAFTSPTGAAVFVTVVSIGMCGGLVWWAWTGGPSTPDPDPPPDVRPPDRPSPTRGVGGG